MSKKIKCQILANKNSNHFDGTRKAILPDSKYHHVSLVIGKHWYNGGYGINLIPLSKEAPFVTNKERLVINFTLSKKQAKKIMKRFMSLDGFPVYEKEDHVRFMLTGKCLKSKSLKAFACSCFIMYLLGEKDYWKINSDQVVKRYS